MVVARRNMLLLRKWGGFTRSDVVFVVLSYYRYKNNKLAPNPEREKCPPGGESEPPGIRKPGKTGRQIQTI